MHLPISEIPTPAIATNRYLLGTIRVLYPALVVLCCIPGACSPITATREGALDSSQTADAAARSGHALFPDSIADPLEPMNRGFWALNRGLLVGVMQPSGRVYRTVVPSPVRRSIRDFTRNITYPGRCVNHLLQGRWNGAGDESLRFLCNTTVGVGGLFDVATRWNIPKSNADFAQTFNKWGWGPQTYIMLPFLGPSDECHAVGLAADGVAEPWSYSTVSRAVSYGSKYNSLADKTEEAARLIQSTADPYANAKYTWTYISSYKQPDWTTTKAKDAPSFQTLDVALITYKNPKFPQLGQQMSVRIPTTGRYMKFNCWLQPESAPIVYIAPGIGSHRLSLTTLALAENLFLNGFSVVATTNVFHPEFMEHASTAALPAYPPVDCRDLLVELTAIDGLLEKKHPGLLGKRALLGFSMGGFDALHIAAREKQEKEGLLRFDRYVAINTPVQMDYAVTCIDRFSHAADAWSPKERQFRANNAVLKAAKLLDMPDSGVAGLPFDGIESKFLIGLTFRMTLRDTIYSSQARHNLGVLSTPISPWKREPLYQEIVGYSYRDYFLKFAIPYYHEQGIGMRDFNRENNLMSYGNSLRTQKKTRVIINRNDFLLTASDIAWMQSTFTSSRLKIFPEGGHLGNLASSGMQKAIIRALGGLR